MRCKPGDMAVIVNDDFPENIGVFVEVLRRSDHAAYYPGQGHDWEVYPSTAVRGRCGERILLAQAECSARDADLWPIRPPGQADGVEAVKELETT